MDFNELFEQRVYVGKKLKEILKENGFSKVSFSKTSNISRPTLDKLLNGEIESKSTFDKHMKKILSVLDLSVDNFLLFRSSPKPIEAVFSQNAPSNYELNDKAKKQYDLLMDILNLCNIYY